MEFKYHCLEHLPSLAWCARVDNGCGDVHVYCGPGVEAHADFFIEGAWDGPFVDGRGLTEATAVSGTGGCLREDAVWFSSSTDRLCPIFSVAKPGRMWISNSPVFVLCAAGESLDVIHPFYPYDWLRIWRAGLHALSADLKTTSTYPLRVHFSALLIVTSDGTVRYQPHRLCPPPSDYESYRDLLKTGVQKVFENASDSLRRVPFQPLAAISKGYDSTATAALAGAAGCRDTVSYTDSRHDHPDVDNGQESARHLGMGCQVIDRWDYLKSSRMIDPEFALVPISATAPLAGLEHCLRGRLLVTGHFGECIWESKAAAYCHHMSLPWARMLSGVSQIEFRLRVGFLVMTPTCLGARHNVRIHEISVSDDLKPWSVGGDYDRPIPRRLAEEAGVPRDLFGHRKMGNGHNHFARAAHFSKDGMASYTRFLEDSRKSASSIRYHAWKSLAYSRRLAWNTVGFKKRRYVPSTRWQRRLPFLLNIRPLQVPFEFLFTFQWAFACLRDRYRLDASDGK